MRKLYLIDASNMFFRAFYAIRQLSNSKGLPTNALYGYLSMTIKLLKENKPDYIAYCFDSKKPSFRADIFPEYKANRTEMPEDLVKQMPYFRKLVDVLGIPTFQLEGVEADDIIGTLTKLGQSNQVQVVIVSGDKDFAQLINSQVSMYDTMKEITYGPQGVKEKWGVNPNQVIDYLALIGDSSDNIPGISGIGPKTALKLLDSHPSLDQIYQDIENIKPDKLREKIKNSKEIAYLSKTLVTIKTDVELDTTLESLKMKPIQRQQLLDLLEELDFKSFERKIFEVAEKNVSRAEIVQNEVTQKKQEEPQPDLSLTVPSVQSINKTDNISSEFSEEVVTPETLLPKIQNKTVWAVSDNRGFYLSADHQIYILSGALEDYKKIFSEANVSWMGFDLKSLLKQLYIQNPTCAWDHQVAAYVVNAGSIGDFSEVCKQYCDENLSDFPTPQELISAHIKLKLELEKRLDQCQSKAVFENIDLPLISILYKMENRGIRVDSTILQTQSSELMKDIKKLETSIYELCGEVFNIASPKQLAHILFEKLKLNPVKKTKTGYSTDSDVLEKLENEHPVARLVIEYRELSKLKSTYVDALPLLMDPKDQRIHTVFHQTVTTTGRLSSSNPNLQNIPIRTERGNSIRKAFVAELGNLLVSADYSQIELRVLAHITDDPGLVKAFEEDLDIHAATASEIFGIPLSEVTAETRRVAKAVNFGLAYGMGPHGLAENLKISRTEASEIIQKYFLKFPNVKKYMSECVEAAKQKGYVETIFGRRRYAPELNSKNPALRNFGERAAVNAPMQGTASDIVKKAMIHMEERFSYKMLLQVHDELIFEITQSDVEAAMSNIKNTMESAVQLKVPLKVNISKGFSWYEAHS